MIDEHHTVNLHTLKHITRTTNNTKHTKINTLLTAASILAGESSLGSDNMLMTDAMIPSTLRFGRHPSVADPCSETECDAMGMRCRSHNTQQE